MTERKPRLMIVDPSLRDQRGHHHELTRVIANAAVEAGCHVVVLSNRHFVSDLGEHINVDPVFLDTTYDSFKPASDKKARVSLKEWFRRRVLSRLPEPLKLVLIRIRNLYHLKRKQLPVEAATKVDEYGLTIDSFASKFVRGLVARNFGIEDHVLFHTADASTYREFLDLVTKRLPLRSWPQIHLCTPYDTRIMPHANAGIPVARVISYLNKLGCIGRYIHLYGENELLSRELSDAWNVPVDVLDIPITIGDGQRDEERREGRTEVVYLGAAREEKGFLLLPEIIRTVLESDMADTIHFTIQCSPQIIGYTAKIKDALEELESISSGSITLVKEQQSSEEYKRTLEAADIVLLYYTAENYRARGSGIVTEAIAHGKNVICTPGTYPEWLAGEAGIPAASAAQAAAGIIGFSRAPDGFRRAATERAEWYLARCRPDKYIDKILSSYLMQDDAESKKDDGNHIDRTLTKEDEGAVEPEVGYNPPLGEPDRAGDGSKMYVKRSASCD